MSYHIIGDVGDVGDVGGSSSAMATDPRPRGPHPPLVAQQYSWAGGVGWCSLRGRPGLDPQLRSGAQLLI